MTELAAFNTRATGGGGRELKVDLDAKSNTDALEQLLERRGGEL